MSIVPPLPYNIQNGQPVDAVPVMANFNQIVNGVNVLATSPGATFVGYSESAAGSVTRTVASKLQEFVSVLDFGADPTGVNDSTAAFTAAAAVSKNPIVPSNSTFLLNSAPAIGNSIFSISANTTITGIGASAIGNNGTGLQTLQMTAGPTDYATKYVRRDASYTGGSAGYVNAGIRADVFVGAGVADYEWAIVGVMNNSAPAGQNVGVYGQGNKVVSVAGPTWGGVMEVREEVATNNPTTGTIGLEVDNRSNGTDSNNERIGIDVVCARYNTAGAATQTGFGVRVQNNSDGTNSIVNTAFGVVANSNVGFDTSLATIHQAAYKMAAGQVIAFDAAAANQLSYDGTGLKFESGGNSAFRANSDGSFAFGGPTLPIQFNNNNTSGSAAPVLTANKPGTGTAIATWLSITVSGTQLWIPAWSN